MKIYFDLEVLIALFGENATNNSIDEFSEHFYNVTVSYLSKNQICKSPFMSQFLIGKFIDSTYYDWFDLDVIQDDLFSKIVFVNESMGSFLSKNTEKLDFLHLSNITDWLDQPSSDNLIEMGYRNLNEDGTAIIRILNRTSTFNKSDFIFDDELAKDLHSKDRSFFDRKIKIGIKKNPYEFFSNYISLADKAVGKSKFLSAKMFSAMDGNQIDFYKFSESQKKFYYAVDYFSRPMCALISRLDDFEKRKTILENILEEHGELDYYNCHSRTFKKFLKSIGTEETLISEEVEEFNSFLMSLCLCHEPEVAYGALGMIEYLFSFVSHKIGKYVLEHHWAKNDIIYHYSVHEILDIKHSVDLFTLVSRNDLEDPNKRKLFIRGLDLGASCFKNLYERIYY